MPKKDNILSKFKNNLINNERIINDIKLKKKLKNKLSDYQLKLLETFEHKLISNTESSAMELKDEDHYVTYVIFLSIKISSAEDYLLKDNKPIKVIDNIYIGSIGSAIDIKQLKKNRITHIISILDFECNIYSNEFEYLYIKSYDNLSDNLHSKFEEIYNYIKTLLDTNNEQNKIYNEKNSILNNTNTLLKYYSTSSNLNSNNLKNKFIKFENNILIHCFAGVSRSGTILISFLMKYFKLNYEKAYNLAKSKRHKLEPNANFKKQLIEYEKNIITD